MHEPRRRLGHPSASATESLKYSDIHGETAWEESFVCTANAVSIAAGSYAIAILLQPTAIDCWDIPCLGMI